MSRDMRMQKETEKIPYGKFLPENLGLILLAPMFLMLLIVFRLTSKIITPPVMVIYSLLAGIFF